MAEFPALPVFTDSLLADTDHLTHEEFGAYMRVLILMWRSPDCRIPLADAWLMRKLKCDANKFNELFRPLFLEFCQSDGAYYTQKRLLKEFMYVRRMSDKNRGASKSRWNKEKHPHSGNAPTPTPTPTVNNNPNGLLDLGDNIQNNTPNPAEPKNAKRPKARKPTSFIPEDFGGDFKAIALAASLGVDFEREQRKFVDHFLAKGEARADWQAGFRNWLNRAAEYRARDEQRAVAGRSNVRDVTGAALRATAAYQKAV